MSSDQEKLFARILLHNKLLDQQDIDDLLMRASYDPEIAIKTLVQTGRLSEGKGRLVTKVYRQQASGLKASKIWEQGKSRQQEASDRISRDLEQRLTKSKSANSRDVFISHSSNDKHIADAVCATLEARNIGCWVAHRDIAGGERWTASIIDALSKSKVMVLILSNESIASPHVHRELERAVEKNIPIIPLRIEDVSLSKEYEYLLSTTQWLDAFGPERVTKYTELSERISHLLAGNTLRQPNPNTPFINTRSAKPDKSYSGVSTASLICGIVGIPLLIPGILAVIFGIIAIRGLSRSGNMKGHGSAKAGLILGIIAVAISLFWVLSSG